MRDALVASRFLLRPSLAGFRSQIAEAGSCVTLSSLFWQDLEVKCVLFLGSGDN